MHLGIPMRAKSLFDPASIRDASGNRLLLQQLLTKRAPTIDGIIYDEKTNKGTARTLQLGRCYLFDGVNDYVNTGSAIDLWKDSRNPWKVNGNFNPTNLTATKRIVAQQGTGTYRGVSIYRGGAALYVDLIHNATSSPTNQLTAYATGLTLVAGTDYTFQVTYDGSKSASGISFIVNGVTYPATATISTLTENDVNSANNLALGNDMTLSFPLAGKVWGIVITDMTTGVVVRNYKCDEQDGTTAYDSSGNGAHGTIINATLATFHSTQNVYSYQNEVGYSKPATVFIPRNEAIPTQDVTGATLQYSGQVPYNGKATQSTCIKLDGINDYINTGINQVFTNSVTVGGWFYVEAGEVQTSIADYFIAKESVFALNFGHTASNFRGFHVNIAGTYYGSGAVTIPTGQWFHFVGKYDGTKIRSYLNGVEASSYTVSGTLFSNANSVMLGAWSANTNCLKGRMAGAFVSANTLTDSQILYMATNGVSGTAVNYQTELLAFYPLAEPAGTIAYDVADTKEATIYNGATRTLQDVFHYNITKGFEYYDDDATHAVIIRVPYKTDGTKKTPTISGYTKIKDCPAGAFHNGAETLIDFTGGVLSPVAVINSWETAWAFNTARTNPEFKRTLTKSAVDYEADRFLAYRTTLASTNLSKVEKYTLTKAI